MFYFKSTCKMNHVGKSFVKLLFKIPFWTWGIRNWPKALNEGEIFQGCWMENSKKCTITQSSITILITVGSSVGWMTLQLKAPTWDNPSVRRIQATWEQILSVALAKTSMNYTVNNAKEPCKNICFLPLETGLQNFTKAWPELFVLLWPQYC